MKLVTFTQGGREAIGALTDDGKRVVDLHAAHVRRLVSEGAHPGRAAVLADATFGDMVALIEAGPGGLEQARHAVEYGSIDGAPDRLDLADVRLESPLRPTRLRDCIAWETHIRNFYAKFTGQEVPEAFYRVPVYYKGNHTTVIGHDADLRWPAYSELWDYELELGIVIGTNAVDVAPGDGESQIFGLTCFNDFSARDTLKEELSVGLGPSKGKDFATAIGPCLVTIDEFDDLYDIDMDARVNGEVWSSGGTQDIYWRFDDIIQRMSAAEPLLPGEIFGSGTIANGCGMELERYLQHGDVVELEIEGVGTLRNRVLRSRS